MMCGPLWLENRFAVQNGMPAFIPNSRHSASRAMSVGGTIRTVLLFGDGLPIRLSLDGPYLLSDFCGCLARFFGPGPRI
jgi:hypothetical protein